MALLEKFQESNARGPHPRKAEALDAIQRFIRGQDVKLGGNTVNRNVDAPFGRIINAFIDEFGDDGRLLALPLKTSGTKIEYCVAEVVHSFHECNANKVYVLKGAQSSMNIRSGFCFAALDQSGVIVTFTGAVTEGVASNYQLLQREFMGRLPPGILANMFHDQIIDQLIISEIVKRGLDPHSNYDRLFATCMLSPAPAYSMLFALSGHRSAEKMLSKLGVNNIAELLFIPEEIVAGGPAAVYSYMIGMNAMILEVTNKYLSGFFEWCGVKSMEELMPKERQTVVHKEIFGEGGQARKSGAIH